MHQMEAPWPVSKLLRVSCRTDAAYPVCAGEHAASHAAGGDAAGGRAGGRGQRRQRDGCGAGVGGRDDEPLCRVTVRHNEPTNRTFCVQTVGDSYAMVMGPVNTNDPVGCQRRVGVTSRHMGLPDGSGTPAVGWRWSRSAGLASNSSRCAWAAVAAAGRSGMATVNNGIAYLPGGEKPTAALMNACT